MKLRAMPCRTTQDGSWWRGLTKCGPLENKMQTTSVVLPWEPHKQNVRQKDRIWKDELPRSVGAQYATGEEQRNRSRKNEEAEPKQKQHPLVDVSGGENRAQCCKQYCIGTWNGRSMKWPNRRWQEWTLTFYESVNKNGLEWANLIQMTIISTTEGKKSLRRNGGALLVNKSQKCSTWV